jgi:hypothetical protein
MSFSSNELNEKVKSILELEPRFYSQKFYELRYSQLDYSDVKQIAEYYSMTRAFIFVAKRYFNADYDLLLKNILPLFWDAEYDLTETNYFTDGLLAVSSNCSKHIRELKIDRGGLTIQNYLGISRIDNEIEIYNTYIQYLEKVNEYIHSHLWRLPDYLQLDIYQYRIHIMESVKKLAKKGIELEDIIDDINKRSESFYTIALLWHLNIVQQLLEEHGGKTVTRVNLTLSEWISQKASAESIGNYISYLKRRENGELSKKTVKSSYETSIHEIKTRYSLE